MQPLASIVIAIKSSVANLSFKMVFLLSCLTSEQQGDRWNEVSLLILGQN